MYKKKTKIIKYIYWVLVISITLFFNVGDTILITNIRLLMRIYEISNNIAAKCIQRFRWSLLANLLNDGLLFLA